MVPSSETVKEDANHRLLLELSMGCYLTPSTPLAAKKAGSTALIIKPDISQHFLFREQIFCNLYIMHTFLTFTASAIRLLKFQLLVRLTGQLPWGWGVGCKTVLLKDLHRSELPLLKLA
jgi:hypothetical protein